jgi:flagellar protein FlaI
MNLYKRIGKKMSLAKESFSEEKEGRERIVPKFTSVEVLKDLTEEELVERAIAKLKDVNEYIPLIRMNFKESRRVVVQGNIRWDGEKLVYYIIEPEMSANASDVFSILRNSGFDDYKKTIKELEKISKRRNLSISEVLSIQYQIFKYFKGSGKIEPLLHDPNIEIIECGRNVRVKHKDPLFEWITTDIMLNRNDLDLIYERVKNSDKTRVWFDGVFRIKKFNDPPMDLPMVLRDGLVNREILAYLWFCIENGLSICIAGTSSSGITSLMQALGSLVHPKKKVATAEKDPEMRFDRENWKPFISYNLFDSVRNALNERSDYTFVNDVEGEESYIIFQAMNSGYPMIFTTHHENMGSLINNLKNNVPPLLIESLDLLIFNVMRKKGGKMIRRAAEVNEIISYDRKTGEIVMNPSFRWDPEKDDFEPIKSILLEKLGMSEEDVKKDLDRKLKLLKNAEKSGEVKGKLFR